MIFRLDAIRRTKESEKELHELEKQEKLTLEALDLKIGMLALLQVLSQCGNTELIRQGLLIVAKYYPDFEKAVGYGE